MVRKSVSEILHEIGEQASFQDRVKVMRSYRGNNPLRAILKYAFDPRIKFLLPEGTPPYKENDFPDQQGNLYYHFKKLYLYIEGGNTNTDTTSRPRLELRICCPPCQSMSNSVSRPSRIASSTGPLGEP